MALTPCAGGGASSPPTGSAAAGKVVLAPDGKIVAAGRGKALVVARYRLNGTLDPTFGNHGIAATEFTSKWGSGTIAVAVGPDRKVIALGWRNYKAPDRYLPSATLVLARYLPDGRLDRAFGRGGRLRTSTTKDAWYSTEGVVQQAGHKIVVIAGTIVRYRSNGRLDPAFGRRGTVDNWGPSFGVAAQPDGKIVLTGSYLHGGEAPQLMLWRYLPDGRLDPHFGDGGHIVTTLGRKYGAVARAVAVQPDGHIVVAGDFGLARFTSDGSLDTDFGTPTAPHSVLGPSLTIEADGKIVVGGCGALARYTADGSPDPTFGSGGRVSGKNLGCLDGLTVQRDGKILASGTRSKPTVPARPGDFFITRYTAHGRLDPKFGSAGRIVDDLPQR